MIVLGGRDKKCVRSRDRIFEPHNRIGLSGIEIPAEHGDRGKIKDMYRHALGRRFPGRSYQTSVE